MQWYLWTEHHEGLKSYQIEQELSLYKLPVQLKTNLRNTCVEEQLPSAKRFSSLGLGWMIAGQLNFGGNMVLRGF